MTKINMTLTKYPIFIICILQCITCICSLKVQPSNTSIETPQTVLWNSTVVTSKTVHIPHNAFTNQTAMEPSQTLTAPKILSKSSLSTLNGITATKRVLVHNTSTLTGSNVSVKPTQSLSKSSIKESPVLSRSLPTIPENTIIPTKTIKLTDDATVLQQQHTSGDSVVFTTTSSMKQGHSQSKSFVVHSSSVLNRNDERIGKSTKIGLQSSSAHLQLTPSMTSYMHFSTHSSTLQLSPSLIAPQKVDVSSTLSIASRAILSESTLMTAQPSRSSLLHSLSDQNNSRPVTPSTQLNKSYLLDSMSPVLEPPTRTFVGGEKSEHYGHSPSSSQVSQSINHLSNTTSFPTSVLSTEPDFASKLNSRPFLVSSSSLGFSRRMESIREENSTPPLQQNSSVYLQTTSLPFIPKTKVKQSFSELSKTSDMPEITSPTLTPTPNPQVTTTKWISSLESRIFAVSSLPSNSNESFIAPSEQMSSNIMATEHWSAMLSPSSLNQTASPFRTEAISSTLSLTTAPYMSYNLSHIEHLNPSHSTSYSTMPISTSSVELHSALETITTGIIQTRMEVNESRIHLNASNISELVSSTTDTIPFSVSSSQIGIPIVPRPTQYSKLLKFSKTLSADSTLSQHSSTVRVYSITPSNRETQMYTHISHPTQPIIKSTNSTPLETSTPPLSYNKTFEITFTGQCAPLKEKNLYGQFSDNIRYKVSHRLSLSYEYLILNNLTCASVHVYVTLMNVVEQRVAEGLKDLVGSRSLNLCVTTRQGELHYSAVTFKTITKPSVMKELQPNVYEKDSKTSVITIACSAIVAMLVIGLFIALRECYRRKHTQTFDLTNTPNVHMKLEDFTLTRIPRSNTWYSDEGVAIQRFSETNGSTMQKSSNGISKQPTISCISDILKDKEANEEDLRPFSYSILSSNSRKDSQDTTVSITSDSNFGYSTDSLVPLPKGSSSMHGAVNPIYFGDEIPQIDSNSRYDQSTNSVETHEQFRQVYKQ